MKPVKIPSYLDEHARILFWRLDAFILGVMFFLAGIVFDHAFIGILAALLFTNYYEKVMGEKHKGWLFNFFYSIGLVPKSGNTIVDPYIRRYYK